MDVTALRKAIDEVITQWASGAEPSTAPTPANEITEVKDDVPQRNLPKDKRVVRTKTSGDRVFLLDEKAKTRQWITSPTILEGLGFEHSDVAEVEDMELLKYNMAAALYAIPEKEPDA